MDDTVGGRFSMRRQVSRSIMTLKVLLLVLVFVTKNNVAIRQLCNESLRR